jgi:hypothetical protein
VTLISPTSQEAAVLEFAEQRPLLRARVHAVLIFVLMAAYYAGTIRGLRWRESSSRIHHREVARSLPGGAL